MLPPRIANSRFVSEAVTGVLEAKTASLDRKFRIGEVEMMLKKMVLVGGAAAVLVGMVAGRSHLLTTVGIVKQQVKNSVPLEFEIERARQMIKDLDPEIEQNLRLIAQEEVEVAKLEDRLAQIDEKLAIDKRHILLEKDHLASGDKYFLAAKNRRQYTQDEVTADLASRFAQFKTEAQTRDSLKMTLAARQASLEAAREKFNEMIAAKRQLEVEIENQVASLAMVDVKKAAGNFRFDDSKLARTKELVEEIRTRIEVQARLANADTFRMDRIPLDEPEENVDISEEIAQYFAEDVDELVVNH
jgi:hypothetical protein